MSADENALLASEVRRLQAKVDRALLVTNDPTCRKSMLNMVVNLRIALEDDDRRSTDGDR